MEAVLITSNSPLSIEEMTHRDLAAGLVPRYLYKYRAGILDQDGNLNHRTAGIFQNSELWYPSPSTFNDPYDCNLQLDTNNTQDEIAVFIKANNPHLEEAIIQQTALEWFNNPDAFHKLINDSAYAALNSNGIGCFSPNAENLLMWAHYAESHRGICLKFDILVDPAAFAFILKVNYPQDYPSWNHVRAANGETTTKMITTKSSHWKYEDEWRVLKMGMPGAHGFAREALREVVFGCNASPESIAKTIEVLNESGMSHVELKKANKTTGRYSVDIRPL